MKITEVLSIYAAILSSMVFLWNVARATPRFKVDLGVGLNEENGECKSGIFISIRNPSPHTVHLANVSILYQSEKVGAIGRFKHMLKYHRLPYSVGWVHSSLSIYEIDDKCPLALEPGTSHNIFIPEGIIEKILGYSEYSKLKACVQDQLFRNKYSPELKWP